MAEDQMLVEVIDPTIKGSLIMEGKTKKIYQSRDEPDLVVIQNKDDITAFDNPEFTKKFGTKAVHATTTTCRVFELLQAASVPVAYTRQLSATEFLAPACKMIPLEAVARRYAVGSYIKRRPDCEATPPMRFHRIVTEYFLKTTGGKLVVGLTLVEGLDPKAGEEDPFIMNFFGDGDTAGWDLMHPKKPTWDSAADLDRLLGPTPWAGICHPEHRTQMDDMLRTVFLVLEGAFAHQLGLRFIDLKIEFGLTTDGKLVVADVIDNDSWRLRTSDWTELSKEAFRQGEALEKVETKYAQVADLVSRFRVPKQAIVLWRGSEKDAIEDPIERRMPPISPLSTSVSCPLITISGHKSPGKMLRKLEEVMTEFPDGGVIIAKVGMSNGLAPTLAARTSWPVIAVPASFDKFPEDVWSSLRVPSQVPLATVLGEQNAVDLALNMLALSNPVAYAMRQMRIEALDE
jgi:phosphoribosylaminoimidazole carboxylase / phosphoribosylaminoimidazole-succinocarboxamide synthase